MCASNKAIPGLRAVGVALSEEGISLASLSASLAILRDMNSPKDLRLALAQVNPVVGAVEENRAMVASQIEEACEAGAALVVFPELVLSGYPPDDLVFRRDFLTAVRGALEDLATRVTETVALVGFPEAIGGEVGTEVDPLSSPLKPIAMNSVAILRDGEISQVYRKRLLPNYGVFDERRHFEAGDSPLIFDLDGTSVGVTVCEDIWVPDGPVQSTVAAGADLIVNCSASPYARGKSTSRSGIVASRARESSVPIALCNMVGAQDELVFDGASVVCAADGDPISLSPQFEESLTLVDIAQGSGRSRGEVAPSLADLDEVYGALVLGLRDYVRKNGFDHVVFGLSGGIDSALVAMLAIDALGPEAVSCVVMPSPHSSQATQQDAREFARELGSDLIELPIGEVMGSFESTLSEAFAGSEPGLAEENIQARIRGTLVMGLSNKFGWLPLATGNKSELAVGYATLYGDMAGGFAPIKDVPKTLVYQLAEAQLLRREDIGTLRSIIDRPPSAELRPDQLDSDSLPPYEELDGILELYVERDQGREEIVERGFDPSTVDEVLRMIDRAEYKRRQAPPGTRISSKAFGRDRRLPVTNRFGSLRPLPR